LHSFAFGADFKNLKHNRDFGLCRFSADTDLSENLAQCVDWSLKRYYRHLSYSL